MFYNAETEDLFSTRKF